MSQVRSVAINRSLWQYVRLAGLGLLVATAVLAVFSTRANAQTGPCGTLSSGAHDVYIDCAVPPATTPYTTYTDGQMVDLSMGPNYACFHLLMPRRATSRPSSASTSTQPEHPVTRPTPTRAKPRHRRPISRSPFKATGASITRADQGGDLVGIYSLPDSTFPGSTITCNATNPCVWYVGEDYNSFTEPHVFSNPFFVTPATTTTTTTLTSSTTTTPPTTTPTTTTIPPRRLRLPQLHHDDSHNYDDDRPYDNDHDDYDHHGAAQDRQPRQRLRRRHRVPPRPSRVPRVTDRFHRIRTADLLRLGDPGSASSGELALTGSTPFLLLLALAGLFLVVVGSTWSDGLAQGGELSSMSAPSVSVDCQASTKTSPIALTPGLTTADRVFRCVLGERRRDRPRSLGRDHLLPGHERGSYGPSKLGLHVITSSHWAPPEFYGLLGALVGSIVIALLPWRSRCRCRWRAP